MTLMSVEHNIVRRIGPALGGVTWPSLDQWPLSPWPSDWRHGRNMAHQMESPLFTSSLRNDDGGS
ncbi:hypothetical protein NKJ28_31105 [Mesorhizobium sp. M0145]|uniref:hypothetical protein n=1 Tax=Mesorhizobium sp. M0145 TaxID=2956895 RepID=UPI003335D1C9